MARKTECSLETLPEILTDFTCHLVQATLVDIGKKLKKNNIAVDVVGLAAEEENIPKLEAFQVGLCLRDVSNQPKSHAM